MKTRGAVAAAVSITVAMVLISSSAAAEQLPLKNYTTADGLASDLVQCILSDSHGYLWFGTADGISRFDGYGFTNMSVADGLPGANVHAIIEARDGTYWAATNAGVFHWDPARGRIGSHDASNSVHVDAGGRGDDVRTLLEDRAGAMWVGTLTGLYRLDRAGNGWTVRRLPVEPSASAEAASVNALCEDSDGSVWIGTNGGLFRRMPSGAIERVAARDGSPHAIRSLLRERGRDGPLWAGSHEEGIFQIRRASGNGEVDVRLVFSRASGLAGNYIPTLLEASDGRIWAGSFPGVTEISADRTTTRSYTAAEGLPALGIFSLGEDRDGNLWMGSDDGGVMRLGHDGFRRFDTRDGLASTCVDSLFENRDGQLCAFTRGTKAEEIAVDRSFVECFDGARFHAQQPALRPGVSFGWGMSQLVLQDRQGEWWIPSLGGLYRFPAVPFARLGAALPRKIYTEKDGLPSSRLFRLFEDSDGNIWVGFGVGERPLARWDRATETIRSFSAADGIPPEPPVAFAQDRTGAVWIGFASGLARFRSGTMRFLGVRDGLPPGGVHALYVDGSGRLWVATATSGVARLDRPEEERLRFVSYGAARGLSSGSAFSVTEDLWGRIYVGTPRGMDRLDPRGGIVQHFTADDGLPHSDIETSFRDRQGNLWFGSAQGLSRLQPVVQNRKRPPDIRITRVLADGVREPLPDLGASEVRLRDLGPGGAPVQIDFLAVDFAPGGRPRYQYMLEGIDRNWSAATDQRSVVYGHLAPGRYRFRARGIGNDLSVGPSPAEVRFTILAPFWHRPEVLALLAAAAAALGYLLHRRRLENALAVERVRMRVATDLHDDVGAGLSEIAILSELARRQESEGKPLHALETIGDSARRLVDAMSDIVWSTDPRKDDVASLTQRIRHFAANALESQGIRWTFDVPPEFETRRLDPETRRQMLLIVQEALTNVARHARCTRASVRIAPDARGITVEIEDDGPGFSTSDASPGRGLANMRSRAFSLGGEFAVFSLPDQGTRVVVRVPLRGR